MNVTLPDGKELELQDGATGADAARAIGEGLARAALAIKVNGDLRDLSAPLNDGEPIEIVTNRSPDALALLRHDTAHVLAEAVLELYPGTQVTIGPPIEDGFYYDFDFPEGVKISDAYLERLEQARARDHRKLGKELGLFMFSELAPGLPFWQPAGTQVWNELTTFWRRENVARGYTEVRTPLIYDLELWKQSGHWEQYRDHMYFTDVEDHPMGLKPMNCPAHIQIYKE